jgi:hypothetical protein
MDLSETEIGEFYDKLHNNDSALDHFTNYISGLDFADTIRRLNELDKDLYKEFIYKDNSWNRILSNILFGWRAVEGGSEDEGFEGLHDCYRLHDFYRLKDTDEVIIINESYRPERKVAGKMEARDYLNEIKFLNLNYWNKIAYMRQNNMDIFAQKLQEFLKLKKFITNNQDKILKLHQALAPLSESKYIGNSLTLRSLKKSIEEDPQKLRTYQTRLHVLNSAYVRTLSMPTLGIVGTTLLSVMSFLTNRGVREIEDIISRNAEITRGQTRMQNEIQEIESNISSVTKSINQKKKEIRVLEKAVKEPRSNVKKEFTKCLQELQQAYKAHLEADKEQGSNISLENFKESDPKIMQKSNGGKNLEVQGSFVKKSYDEFKDLSF